MAKPKYDLIKYIHETALKLGTNNCVTRHQCKTSIELDEFDLWQDEQYEEIKLPEKLKCYGCSKMTDVVHGSYVYSCVKCGNKFHRYRFFEPVWYPQKVAIVTGARTKLGHQICLKLLRTGAFVFGTTRFPEKALEIFSQYGDYNVFKDRLFFYALDLDVPNLESEIEKFREFVSSKFNHVDILINCAAQTIRTREKMTKEERSQSEEHNRYGDNKFVRPGTVNSWNMELPDLQQDEMEELFRINSIAPVLITKVFLHLLKQSEKAFIINVHAKEGLFDIHKTSKHMHTNMAKAALAMFTRVLIEHNYVSEKSGRKFSIHGCDPGWISVDEYELDGSVWITPPLDERDGAARVLCPILLNRESKPKTRRHFDQFLF